MRAPSVRLTPLTPEEQRYAEEHFDTVAWCLGILHANDDCYDAAVMGYLQSVKKWFARPELQHQSFRTICKWAIKREIGNMRNSERRRIQTVSLDDVIPGTDGMTYGDTITYKNLDYINIQKDGGDMNIKYNVKLPEKKAFRGSVKSDEVLAIESFLVGKMKNMQFEYDETSEAKRKLSSIQTYRRKQEQKELYDVYRVENSIYIVRLSKKEGAAK